MSLLACYSVVTKLNDVACDVGQICHENAIAPDEFSYLHMHRFGRKSGLKVKRSTIAKLASFNTPFIVEGEDNQHFVVAQKRNESWLMQVPGQAPEMISEAELKHRAIGAVYAFKLREKLASTLQKFDISWFLPVLKKYKKHFIEVLLASFFVQLFALVTPLFFQVTIDKVMAHQAYTTLDVLAFGLLVISCFDVLFNALRTYLFSHTTNRVDVMLGTKLYSHLMSLPVSFFLTRQVGTTIARVRELDTLRQFITGSGLTLVVDVVFTLIFFSVLYYFSPKLTAVVALSVPFYLAMALVFTPLIRNRLNELFKYGAQNQAFLVESVTGAETLKALAVEPQLNKQWGIKLSQYVSSAFKSGQLNNISSSIAQLIDKVVTVLILWIGAAAVMAGDMSVGQLIAFNMIAGRISGPILRLVQLWQEFQQAKISIQRLGDILNLKPEHPEQSTNARIPQLKGQVSFEQVGFRYNLEGKTILDGLNLQIPAGQTVGVVGRSGSGKSTLAKLVQRMYLPSTGRILIDGYDVSQLDPAWLRRQIGVVLQDSFLFSKSIYENIVIAQPASSMEAVVAACKLAGAHDFISDLPEGYNTKVEERGTNLSGGQRQRIAIARALIANPKILIFDEATSALDYESESVIRNNMAEIVKNRTVIIIAHRLNTLKNCDQIVCLEQGRIQESGNHQSLLAQNGRYAQMWQQQMEANQ